MIESFRGYRATLKAGPLQDLVAPPYDKIDDGLLPKLRARSPRNAVHLIRGETGPDDHAWHAQAARLLKRWLAEGWIAQEDEPSYYVIRQSFEVPGGAGRHERTAVVGALDLRAAARVHHHERTHARAKEDRLRLLRATGAHLGQIFLLRRGREALHARHLPVAGVGTVEDEAGVRSSFGVVRDPLVLSSLRKLMEEGEYVIADGHHRFTTACAFFEERPEADRVMVSVVDLQDPGLLVLSTHRLLRGLDPERVQEAFSSLQGLERLPAGAEAAARVREAGGGTVGLVGPAGESFLWRPGAGGPTGPGSLDVSRLHELLIDPLLAGEDVEDRLSYHRDPAPAEEQIRRGSAQLLALLAPVPAADLFEVAAGGGLMPQKSTDFFPKIPTGFVYLATPAAPWL